MSAGLSHRIVSFIASLYPLYEYTTVEGRAGARSLTDGTLIFPLDDDDDENEFVDVHWQGDPNRTCQTLGHSVASIAVAR